MISPDVELGLHDVEGLSRETTSPMTSLMTSPMPSPMPSRSLSPWKQSNFDDIEASPCTIMINSVANLNDITSVYDVADAVTGTRFTVTEVIPALDPISSVAQSAALVTISDDHFNASYIEPTITPSPPRRSIDMNNDVTGIQTSSHEGVARSPELFIQTTPPYRSDSEESSSILLSGWTYEYVVITVTSICIVCLF